MTEEESNRRRAGDEPRADGIKVNVREETATATTTARGGERRESHSARRAGGAECREVYARTICLTNYLLVRLREPPLNLIERLNFWDIIAYDEGGLEDVKEWLDDCRREVDRGRTPLPFRW
ncbi:hypothetical protein LTR09_009971 [Extremus antarcticus]|uniref:Uncharacterized protein n=1 Tax=Extremus antarcticus TaxID=702011 RepID=A0AAJ0D7Z4_9PEZI|nr:hypothetical protein LTR09_009971 [Extremus antarcticus]